MVKLVGIAGSLREGSYSHQALAIAARTAQALGAEVTILDLRQLNLPFCDGTQDYEDYPDVALLRQTVQDADGLILVTPEYHGSVSGVLKNAWWGPSACWGGRPTAMPSTMCGKLPAGFMPG
jgi:FMN reductase